jgi:fucose 4-O-acetylase-like acetyltransferase
LKARYSHIDVAKGIGILFIVLGHYWGLVHGPGEVYRIIFSFHVPLFFFLSGVLMDYSDDLSATAVKKFSSYLKPYFVILALASIYFILYENTNPIEYFLRVLYGTGPTIPNKFLPLWFLPHLWLVSLFSCLIFKHTNLGSKPLVFKSVCLGILLCIGYLGIQTFWPNPGPGIRFPLPGLPFSMDLVLISSFYFILGSLLKDYNYFLSSSLNW